MAENVLTRKLGPLPTWGWVAVAGGGVVAYALWQRRQGANSSTAGNSTLTPPEILMFPPEQDADEGQDGNTPDRHHRRHHGRPGQVKIPNEVGKDYMEGAADLKKHGLNAERQTPFVGKIRSQSPHAGTKVRRNTTVDLRGKPWPLPWQSKPPSGTAAPNSHPVR